MLSNLLSSIEDISIFPIIGLFIFIPIFAMWVVYALKLDKKEVERMGNLPLDSNENDSNQK